MKLTDNTATNSVSIGYCISTANTASNTDKSNSNMQHKNSLGQKWYGTHRIAQADCLQEFCYCFWSFSVTNFVTVYSGVSLFLPGLWDWFVVICSDLQYSGRPPPREAKVTEIHCRTDLRKTCVCIPCQKCDSIQFDCRIDYYLFILILNRSFDSLSCPRWSKF